VLLGLAVIGLFIFYLVFQGVRVASAWRTAAEKGDPDVIAQIVEDAIGGWRSGKKPKPISPEVWRGIQSMQLVGVEAGLVRVSCISEGEQKMVNGEWVETINPLDAAFGIAARSAERLFYDMPYYRPERVQLDVYATYRDATNLPKRECILTLSANRDDAKAVDWDEWSPREIVDGLGGRYEFGPSGRALEVVPDEPYTVLPGENGAKAAVPS
jgi:hypothetical protein